mgnify:CR=1 FL=1
MSFEWISLRLSDLLRCFLLFLMRKWLQAATGGQRALLISAIVARRAASIGPLALFPPEFFAVSATKHFNTAEFG